MYKNIEIKYITLVLVLVLVSWPSNAIYSPVTNTVPWATGRRQVPFANELKVCNSLKVIENGAIR